MLDHDIIEAIRSSESQTDAHAEAHAAALARLRSWLDDGEVVARVHLGPSASQTPLPRLLVEALVGSTTWRD